MIPTHQTGAYRENLCTTKRLPGIRSSLVTGCVAKRKAGLLTRVSSQQLLFPVSQ